MEVVFRGSDTDDAFFSLEVVFRGSDTDDAFLSLEVVKAAVDLLLGNFDSFGRTEVLSRV